ncbi:MAG TPA: DNA ligase-associated DEXH box helicase, partial [Flavobacteriales bacterium]|nr:DNA ligase-associated DEXH box helicase [Flavobacteriales bacterium]
MTSVHDPLLAWFDSQGWTPQPFQQSAWDACAEGKSGLIQSPTGSGKTYAVLGHVLASHVGKPERAGLKVLWISPLRALSSDIASAAERMVEGLGLNWEVGTRTGDTSSKVKAAQKARLPDILVTTPESLHVLIAQRDSSKLFQSMEMMVVDEWHALVGSKRGVQVELAWSWMQAVDQRRNGKPMLLWGMSATMATPTQAMEVLMGTTRKGCIVANDASRPVELVSLMPKAFEPLP